MLDGQELAKRVAAAMEGVKPKPIARSELARACKVTPQAVNGWLKTGKIARKHFPKIARATGKPIDYFFGETTDLRDARDTPFLDGLPDGLRRYLARKADELRAYAAALPSFIKESLKPPENEDEYRAWERSLDADMARFRFAANAKRDHDVNKQEAGQPPPASARRRARGSSRA